METSKIRSFTDLNAWRESYKLSLMVYRVTKSFPREEMFGLISQIRRCAVSVASNIAEGFSRKTKKEKIQFFSVALGSVTELQNQLLIATGVHLLPKKEFDGIVPQCIKVHKLVCGLIRKCKSSL